jgi:hypothetical protein
MSGCKTPCSALGIMGRLCEQLDRWATGLPPGCTNHKVEEKKLEMHIEGSVVETRSRLRRPRIGSSGAVASCGMGVIQYRITLKPWYSLNFEADPRVF